MHAPLVERLIELPMDVTGGRISGELTLRAHDEATWHFPSFGGRVQCAAKALGLERPCVASQWTIGNTVNARVYHIRVIVMSQSSRMIPSFFYIMSMTN